jgi:hypothetical protein
LFAGLVLGCAGADGPDPERPPSATVITEIQPADLIGRRPRFISLAPQLAREGEPYQYGIFAVEGDGEEVRLSLVRAPEGAVLDGTLLKWTPEHAQAGRPQRFTLRAADGQGDVEDQSWTVTPRPQVQGGIPPGPRTRH